METTMPTSAATKVFDIPELREAIIALVPQRDVLAHVQRVCRTWKITVEDSLLVQQHLGRHKGTATPAEKPTRIATPFNQYVDANQFSTLRLTDELDDETDDFGIPIYKAPIEINNVFKRATDLYQDCYMSNDTDPARKYFGLAGPNWSKHTITIHSRKLQDYPNGRPAFQNNPDLSWRSFLVCDPPVTAARLQTYSGPQLWTAETFDFGSTDPTGILTTIFDKGRITLGLVHDMAAATLRYQTGEEDPRLGWDLDLCWGTEDSPEDQGSFDDSDDQGGEDGEDALFGESDVDDDMFGEDDKHHLYGDYGLDDLQSAGEDGGVNSGGGVEDGGVGEVEEDKGNDWCI